MKVPEFALFFGAMSAALLVVTVIIDRFGINEPVAFAGGAVGGVLGVFAVRWWKRRQAGKPPD